MSLYNDLKNYIPVNEQEERDKAQMLRFIEHNDDYLYRENEAGHFVTSAWAVNRDRTKTLMVYHKIYDSWSWIGGHADGEADLCATALRELQEETGVKNINLVSDEIFSIETLTVDGHVKKGVWVPGHLHFNLTYLVEVDEEDELFVQEDENSGVRWFTFEDALKASTEPWMVEHVYEKLVAKCGR